MRLICKWLLIVWLMTALVINIECKKKSKRKKHSKESEQADDPLLTDDLSPE